MKLIHKILLRHRNNRKISKAIRKGCVLGGCLFSIAGLGAVTPALANPAPQGQSLSIYAGGGAQARGDAYGSERTYAHVYYGGAWHYWVGCYRSTWSVHLWICNNLYVPVGYWAYAQLAYYNANGWSWGYSPWAYSSCCESHTATNGVLG